MSALIDLIYAGAMAVAELTEGAVKKAIEQYEVDKKLLSFPIRLISFPLFMRPPG